MSRFYFSAFAIAFLAGCCTANLLAFRRDARQKTFLLQRGKYNTVRRVQQANDDATGLGPDSGYCERVAGNHSSANVTCSCNRFDNGVVELSCRENCVFCGNPESWSCGQFSFAANVTEGISSDLHSYTTRFQYDGTGGRNELISMEEIDCNDFGECKSCRVVIDGTLCSSCSLCSDGAIVDCENVAEGSIFNSCQSLTASGLFEGLSYNVVKCGVYHQPPNDNCTSAIRIIPGDIVSAALVGALEDNVPLCPTSAAGTHGVWYSFEGTGTTMLVSTCSLSEADEMGFLTVYQGSGCDILQCPVGSSHLSYCPGYSSGSSILLPTQPSATYYVYVSGWSGSSASFDLSLTKFVEQSNDQCAAASEISVDGSSVIGSIEFGQGGDIAICDAESGDSVGVAWYRFVAPQNGTLRASTCARSTIGWMMSAIAITSGDCHDLSCVEQREPYSYYEMCSDGGIFVDFQVNAETTYHVALWGSGYGDVGLLELDIRSLSPPGNDKCKNALRIDVNANFTAIFSDVTLSSDESGEECFEQMGSSTSGGIWYSFFGTGDIIVATTCSNDFCPYLTMYTGTCGLLRCTSPVTLETPWRCSRHRYGKQTTPIQTKAGTVYYILVSGSGPISGRFDFSLRTVEPVENDNCIDAIEIKADGQLIIGNTEGAMYEDFNNSCEYSSRSPGVWYALVGDGGKMKADTCSELTNFDTVISVYRGSCGDLRCVGANDDGCESLFSSFTWDTDEYETYYIRVSGLGEGLTGDYGFKVAPFVPAINDVCDGAIALPIGGALSGTIEVSLGFNEHYACSNTHDWPSLWYYIDGTGTALQVSTCSPNSTIVAGLQAFQGTNCSDLGCVGPTYEDGGYSDFDCPYPAAATWFFAEEGLRYYILLLDESFGGVKNTFALTVTDFEIATNDACETAILIGLTGNETVKGCTTKALADNVTCDYYSSNAPGVWYSVVGTGQTLVASTCSSTLNFDSRIYVYSGECGYLECVAYSQSRYSSCGDSSNAGSQASFRTEDGVEYYILVTGAYSSAVGDFGLSVAEIVPPPNDVCADAIAINPNSGVIVGSLTNATSFFGDNYTCAYDQSARSVWYSLIGTGDVLAISTCSSQLNFDSAISVSTGSCDDHVCVPSNPYNTSKIYNTDACPEKSNTVARVTIRTEVGIEYFIAVEGLYFELGGDFSLTVSTLQVPANDECPGAARIQPDTGTITGSSTNATGVYDYNSISCTYSYDAPDVWYSMIGTGEVYAVSTCSSMLNFDSSISISKGSCDFQECVVFGSYSNSDCLESSYSASRAVFQTEVGVEYFIVVQGVNYPLEGEFTLELATIEPPANDECSGATVIQSNDTAILGSLVNATGTAGFNTFCEYSSGSPGVWFLMIGTGDVYSMSTCSSDTFFDTALSVSTGSCDDQLCITTGAYNDYECSEGSFSAAKVVFRTEVGVEYYIQVQSLSSSPDGDLELHLSTVVVPVNDVCTDAIRIPVGTASISGSITNATESLNADISCIYSYNSPDVWYTMIGTGDTYAVSTCSGVLDFESALSVYSGSCSTLECIAVGAYNDETCENGAFSAAKVVFRTETGVDYYIAVQGINSPLEGDFKLGISTVEVPPNDDCSGALTLVPGDGPIHGSTSIATYSGTNSSCSGFDTSPDLWYRVEGNGTVLTASTCSGSTNYDSQISIYPEVGEKCDGACIATNDDFCGSGCEVEWMANQGVTYYIRVHGFSICSGSFVLHVR